MKTNLLRLFLPMALVFTLVSCSNDSSEDLAPENKLITNYNSTTDEIELARIINQYRVSIGKNQLEIVKSFVKSNTELLGTSMKTFPSKL